MHWHDRLTGVCWIFFFGALGFRLVIAHGQDYIVLAPVAIPIALGAIAMGISWAGLTPEFIADAIANSEEVRASGPRREVVFKRGQANATLLPKAGFRRVRVIFTTEGAARRAVSVDQIGIGVLRSLGWLESPPAASVQQ